MLSTLLSLLSSSGVGSIIGWVGGLLNRKVDLQAKKDEYAYNLAMRDKDLAQTQAEVAGMIAVEDRKIEQAAYGAMTEGLKEQATMLGGKYSWVDAISKLIRPVATIFFLLFSSIISSYILYKAMNAGVEFTTDQWVFWATKILEWVFFQAGVVIGWWFANRPSGSSLFSTGK